ncbi:1-phosphofructokinase family hexose kinase [Flaviaesturariibacter terrae]
MIVTLTLNPALDLSFRVPQLLPEKKLRGSGLRVDAGGGGINVSRAVHILGGSTLALFPSGGCSGQRLREELQKAGIPVRSVESSAETRESVSVLSEDDGQQYRFVLPGEPLEPEVLEQLLATDLPPETTALIISGSMPPRLPGGYLRRWVLKARKAGIRVLGDSSGEALEELLGAGIYLLKPSLRELAALSDNPSLTAADVEQVAKDLIARYNVSAFVVSLGAAGALLVSRNETQHFAAPPLQVKSSAGAGDSLLAGLAWKLGTSANLSDAVAFGVACGSAATQHEGTQLFTRPDVESCYQWVLRNRPLPA